MPVIQELLIALGYRVDKKPIEDAEKTAVEGAQRSQSAWAKAGPVIGKSILAIGAAATAAAVGLFKLVESSTASADEQIKASRTAGMAFDAYQRLNFVAERSAVSSKVLTKSVQNIGKFMEEARTKDVTPFTEALEKVPLSFKELDNLDTEDQLGAIADALNTVEDESQRTAIAQKLLGEEAGPRLASLVALGSKGIRELGDEAERTGRVMEEEAALKAEAFQDALGDLKGTLGAVARDIGLDLAPEIQGLVSDIQEWVIVNGDLLRQDIGELGHSLASGIKAALPVLQDAIGFVTKLSQTTEGFFLLVQDAQDFFKGDDANRKRRIKEQSGERFRNKLAFISGEDLQANIDLQEDPFFANIAQQELDRRKSIAERASGQVRDQAARLAIRSGRGGRSGRGRGGGSGSGGAVDIGEAEFEALDLFGDDLARMGQQVGATDVQLDEAVRAAAQSLTGHASPEVARKAAISKLESLTGSKVQAHDPFLDDLLGGQAPPGVPSMRLSDAMGGFEPQVLTQINNVTNTFEIDFNIDGAGDPVTAAHGVRQTIREELVDVIGESMRSQQVNFGR